MTSNEYEFVADLIDTDTKKWKEDALTNLFSPSEAEVIKSIPISLGGREDKIVWHYTTNGAFSVKSAYYLHKDLENKHVGESSSGNLHSDIWKSIWNLKVPNKVKTFIWRACSNALPTYLWRRKVIKEA